MKKKGVNNKSWIIVVAVVAVLVGVVYLNVTSDLTGRVVANEQEPEVYLSFDETEPWHPSTTTNELKVVCSVSGAETCLDSDGGVNYFVRGTCNDGTGSMTDNCYGNTLSEFSCDAQGACAAVENTINCLQEYGAGWGCVDGACFRPGSDCPDGLTKCSDGNCQTDCNKYFYEDLASVDDYVIQEGDVLEYDIYWISANDFIAFDYTGVKDGNIIKLRDSGAVDQNGIKAHPDLGDISEYAEGQWYHREIALPANHIGGTIKNFDIACASDVSPAQMAYIKNIEITNDGKVVHEIFSSSREGVGAHETHLQKDMTSMSLEFLRTPTTQLVDAVVGKGFEFNGQSDNIKIVQKTPSPEQGSFEAWIKPGSVHTGHVIYVGEEGGNGAGDEQELHLNVNEAGKIVFYFGSKESNGKEVKLVSTDNYEAGQWYHVVGTWENGVVGADGQETLGEMKLYVNGEMVDSSRVNAIETDQWKNRILIGKSHNDLVPRFFNGVVDEVKIYDVVLTAEEVLADYEEGVSGVDITCEAGQIIGDVDGDGDIDDDDTTMLGDIWRGDLSEPSNICCIDVNKDGTFDIDDTTFIHLIVIGQEQSPGTCAGTLPGQVTSISFQGFPLNFAPALGYYVDSIDRIHIWKQGDLYIYNPNNGGYWVGPNTNEFGNVAGKLPTDITVDIGYYVDSIDRIHVWDRGKLYIYNPNPNANKPGWSLNTGEFGNIDDGKLPTGFIPTAGYYIGAWGGRIHLWKDRELYIYNANSGDPGFNTWRKVDNITDVIDLIPGSVPKIGYYYNFDGGIGEGAHLWDQNGVLYVLNMSNYRFENRAVAKAALGLEMGFKPTAGYSFVNNGTYTIHLWDGTKVYELKQGDSQFSLVYDSVEEAEEVFGFCRPYGEGMSVVPVKGRIRVGQDIKYCSFSQTYENALVNGAVCENDFECISNACIQGRCRAYITKLQQQASFIKRILCAVANFLVIADDYCAGV